MKLAPAVSTFVALAALALAAPAQAHHNALEILTDGLGGGPDPAAPANFGASVDDGGAIFETSEPLLPADGDASTDVYLRSPNGLVLLSDRVKAGPDEAKHVSFEDSSRDGASVVFSTTEQLVEADTDTARDVYRSVEWSPPFIVSDRVQAGPDSNESATFVDQPDENVLVTLFVTTEPLTSADGDLTQDVYRTEAGATTLVTDSLGADQAASAVFEGATEDGSEVYFSTPEAMTIADGDTGRDLYARADGDLRILSDRIQGGADDSAAILHFGGNARTGSRVFFTTTEPLVAADSDDDFDVYERSGTTTTLLSDRVQAGADGDNDADFNGASADGGRAFFSTTEPLIAADTDTARDVYERVGGTTRLVSRHGEGGTSTNQAAFFSGVSDDGTRVAFSTEESLRSADQDSAYDVYVRYAGITWLASDRANAGPDQDKSVSLAALSRDGEQLFFTTDEQLAAADADGVTDVYHGRRGVPAALISDGPAPDAEVPVFFTGLSPDGSRAFVRTDQPLLAADTDTVSDVYEARFEEPEPADPGTQEPGPPPGGGGDPAPPGGDPPAPALTLTVGKLAKTVKLAQLRAKGIAVAVEPSVAASFTAELRGNRGLAKAAAGDVILGEGKLASAGGKRTLRVKVPRSQRRRLKRGAKLTLRITATDALGRTKTATRSVKVG
jgi:hypothetical protein